jgi:predicted PolB exonuclease-like 3'-5' exonuclease
MICIFDCETIPDVNLVKSEFGIDGSDIEVSQKAFEIQLQSSSNNSSFLPIPFHKVVSICAVITDDFGRFEKVSCIEGDSERDLIGNFLNFINSKNPKLVSFNGRSFDMPMLLTRAMKYSLSVPAYFEVDNKMLNKTKWDNYRYRFSDRFHVDLMDHISEFGAVRGLKLDLLCSMMGIPGKFDVSGDQVVDLFYKKEHIKIAHYCQSDVLNTYWLYLKYEILKGNITKEDYLELLNIFIEKLPNKRSYSDVFQKAIKEELDRYVSDTQL